MAMSPYRVFRRPILTEKTTRLQHQFTERPGRADYVKYTIEVDPKATKADVRAAIEALFPETSGNIVKINTMHVPGRTKDSDRSRRSRRFRAGRTPARKKAIITLRDGVTIAPFEGL
jgi:large subunit ribosomal protein L23